MVSVAAVMAVPAVCVIVVAASTVTICPGAVTLPPKAMVPPLAVMSVLKLEPPGPKDTAPPADKVSVPNPA